MRERFLTRGVVCLRRVIDVRKRPARAATSSRGGVMERDAPRRGRG